MKNILLIGAGPMAIDYAKVIKALNAEVEVVGRSDSSAREFEMATGIPAKTGGIGNWLSENGITSEKVIVAVNENYLGSVTMMLLEKGAKSILVEKPGGLDFQEIETIAELATRNGANVFVAYNRRFYSSVAKAKEIIAEDGGVRSFNFEFTEWSHLIKDLKKEPGVKERWFLHNSTHVIDLAFYLGGKPKEITCYAAGGLDWHPSGSIYAGAGLSKNGALFSYQANWEAPGRWGVEILTKKHRLIFRPLEKLQVQKLGSVTIESVDIDDKLDMDFKPGLYRQTEAFLSGGTTGLCSIKEQTMAVKLYNKISNYKV